MRPSWLMLLSLFALSVASVASGQAEQEGEPRSASWVLVPGESVGPIQLGMKPREVRLAIGDPDKVLSGDENEGWERWAYLKDPIYVTFSKGVVSTIGAGFGVPIPGSPPNLFAGRTREGIGLESTRGEVVAALGTPKSARTNPDAPEAESMTYREQGLEIGLWKGRVVIMHVHRRPAP